MPASYFRKAFIAVMLLAVFSTGVRADVKLPAVFGSHMVLQRELPVTIWGWADRGEKVVVKIDEQTANAEADEQGAWRVELKPLKADGKAHALTVSGKNTLTLEDVLIGEVWLGSGQSNMAQGVGATLAVGKELPQIRLLQVPPKLVRSPARDIDAEWKASDPKTVADFSAVLFSFGEHLHKDIEVPIGLINSSRGSTAIEQFMPPPQPGPLFNGSIAPLVPFTFRGALWYQGEANVQAGQGVAYAEKLKTMITGWRKAWGREFPFYLVQLAPLKNYKSDALPPVWEAQSAALHLPNTGMIVSTDLAGNMTNIHPGNKQEFGRRLALWALAKDYGRDIEYSSPFYQSMKVEGKRIRLTFAHAKGLKSRDGKALTEFLIAGPDGEFVPAKATIDGETVLVEADGVSEPRNVRFAWKNDPISNLVNGAGLPAAPFQTDDWKGATAEPKRTGEDRGNK